AAVRNVALRSISASCDAEMPSARRQADRSAANSTNSSISEARNGPSVGELSASNDSGGPAPPPRLVSDGGNSTITVVTLAEGLDGHRPVPGQAGAGMSAGAGGANGSAGGGANGSASGGANGSAGGAISGSGAGGGAIGASWAIITTGA